jgi:hypothetical protein
MIDVNKKTLPIGESFFDSMIENGYYYGVGFYKKRCIVLKGRN